MLPQNDAKKNELLFLNGAQHDYNFKVIGE